MKLYCNRCKVKKTCITYLKNGSCEPQILSRVQPECDNCNKVKQLEKDNQKQADLLTKYSCSHEAIKRIRAGENVNEVFDDYGWKIKR
jgi:hypothetical protein